jgi:hypothetical protein
MRESTGTISGGDSTSRKSILIVSHSDFLWHFTGHECDLVNAEMADITHLLEAEWAAAAAAAAQ